MATCKCVCCVCSNADMLMLRCKVTGVRALLLASWRMCRCRVRFRDSWLGLVLETKPKGIGMGGGHDAPVGTCSGDVLEVAGSADALSEELVSRQKYATHF